MALTRKFLSALGIEQDKIDEIIDAHTETTDALKVERDKYKKDAEKLTVVQKELDDLKEESKNAGGDAYKEKYDTLKDEYDKYKSDVETKQTHEAKEKAYRQILKDAKISEKCIDSVLRVSKVDDIELDKDGNIKDADKLKESITNDWAYFIETDDKQGADPNKHPDVDDTDPSNMSMEDYIKFRKG